jgi:hypothetical protein
LSATYIPRYGTSYWDQSLEFVQNTDLGQGEIKFKVKWEGYDKAEDQTWEDEDNLKCVFPAASAGQTGRD